jgi:L-ascorbate metabolism protein UlaG (beta-lactamase superfamily)
LDITWYGHSCFRLAERGAITVVTDPYDSVIGLPELKLKADLVTVSHPAPGHAAIDRVKGTRYVLDGPGEYELDDVFVTGIAMHAIEDDGAHRNVAYLFDFPTGVTVLHLGDLRTMPSQSTIEEMGQVHVALVPVGGGNSLKASMAAEVIALIEPGYVVPMHYALPGLRVDLEPVDRFLKAMGVSQAEKIDTLRISGSDVPEQTQVVLLAAAT